MPKGIPRISEAKPSAIRRRDAMFQEALTERSTGYGYYWNGVACTVGVSTSPGTKAPVAYNVALAPSQGGGFDLKFMRGRPRKQSSGWVGSEDAEAYEIPE